ncbi:sodium/glutamate symporter, partial [Comamonadaceae bacterium OH2545_COT-014]
MYFDFNAYYTLIAATLVLLLGRFLSERIKLLRDFNIPEPVVGGLVAALAFYLLHQLTSLSLRFDASLQNAFMLAFFASIGLSADFARLRQGGQPLLLFLLVVAGYIVLQNSVGVGMAMLMGLDSPLLGLVAGSVSLTGGHGTAGAWGQVFEQRHGLQGAVTLGVACATFGLVLGGLIGGPVARWLVGRTGVPAGRENDGNPAHDMAFEHPRNVRLITASSGMETLAMFAACLAFSEVMVRVAAGTVIELPQFVWALAGGVLVRNGLVLLFKVNMFDRAIDVFGNMSLSLFLAMALLSLRLWELAGLAGSILLILAVQTVVLMLYAVFVTFRVMGADYDAAILAAGHCGFGMGATPTAIANM